MKRTIVTLLAALALFCLAPAASAQEYIPEVSTLNELQEAIEQAQAEIRSKLCRRLR